MERRRRWSVSDLPIVLSKVKLAGIWKKQRVEMNGTGRIGGEKLR